MKKIRGTYTVMITPFTADGRKVDEAALRRLVDFQIAEGIHGLIPLGSTGEFLSVTPDERRQIVEIVVTVQVVEDLKNHSPHEVETIESELEQENQEEKEAQVAMQVQTNLAEEEATKINTYDCLT